MNVRHPAGVFHSYSIKNIFYDKMNLRLFYFRVTNWRPQRKNIQFHEKFIKKLHKKAPKTEKKSINHNLPSKLYLVGLFSCKGIVNNFQKINLGVMVKSMFSFQYYFLGSILFVYMLYLRQSIFGLQPFKNSSRPAMKRDVTMH